jgi:hypothetical protein
MKRNLPFRRHWPDQTYLKLFVDNVTVSKEEIRVSGPKGVPAKAAIHELSNTPGDN